MGWVWSWATVARVFMVGGALFVLGVPVSSAPRAIELTPLGVYRALKFDKGAAEIAAYDPATRRVFVVHLGDTDLAEARVDVLDISNPALPFLVQALDIQPYGSQANSVAVHGGVVAVAVQAAVKTDPGKVVFFDAFGAELSVVTVGALPDMLTFTPNGRAVLVANEAEPNDDYTIDPEGSVSFIDLRRGAASLTDADVTTIGFTAFNGMQLNPRVRIYGPGSTVAQDLEPEYIAVSDDSRTAWVTLQENNAIAVINLRTRRVTSLLPLGYKTHASRGLGLDPSDQDGVNSIQRWPVWGMYQPDAVATFDHRGRTYLVTANEGDVREYDGLLGGNEGKRVSSLTLDSRTFPNAAALQAPAALGRLNVSPVNSDPDQDGDVDRLFAFGGRSFSIWSEAGRLVYDSGDDFEQRTAQRYPANFNASNTNNTRDNRSDDKGPEPEGITVAKLFGRTYVFVALERIGGIMVYDLERPGEPAFVQYINVRDFSADPATAAAEDLGPEGLQVIPAEDSPTGRPLLVVANEISGTTRIFGIRQAK